MTTEDKDTASKSKQGIMPTDSDVLCGRGAGMLNHPGNTTYRNFVAEKKIAYLTRNFKREKRQIANEIVEKIRNLDPPGRFLCQDKGDGEWHEIGDVKAREKTLQALRENAPIVRKQLEQENAVMMAQLVQEARHLQEDAQRHAQAKATAERERRDRGYSLGPQSPSLPSCSGSIQQMTAISNEQPLTPACIAHSYASAGPSSYPPYPVISSPTYVYSYPYPPPSVAVPSPPVARMDSSSAPNFGYNGHPRYYLQPPPPSVLFGGTHPPAPPPPSQVQYQSIKRAHSTPNGSKYKYVAK